MHLYQAVYHCNLLHHHTIVDAAFSDCILVSTCCFFGGNFENSDAVDDDVGDHGGHGGVVDGIVGSHGVADDIADSHGVVDGIADSHDAVDGIAGSHGGVGGVAVVAAASVAVVAVVISFH